ncbi:hypothetical protein Cni_G05186 [Canna indica]|uniref:FAD-dependent oxidoreductase domain-containing protein 1 n=1 Tax=Canna indica TaxID=4628 RepID=A0AAQ3JWK3_9LILI|nr:hypothetical protein Cni_G05186 [Canna indica]
MEAISLPSTNPSFSVRILSSSSFSFRQRFAVSSSPFNPWRSRPRLRARPARSAVAVQKSEHDVVVVGAGIVGLAVARQLLLSSDLSVAVVDAAVPCSGATGAGQGYIWTVHKTPGSETWDLTLRSKQLWEELAESIKNQGRDPAEALGWKKTGSLLVGRTLEESLALEERVRLLNQAGLRAEYLSASSLKLEEPALEIGKEGGAAFVPDDCQIDASQTVSFIEEGNKQFTCQGRYVEFYNDPALSLLRSEHGQTVEGVQTSKNNLYAKRAVVIAAGAWSGPLMKSLLIQPNILPDVPVKPRKGYLLVLENFKKIQLNHGVMEAGYTDHQTATLSNGSFTSEADENDQNISSISMTATLDVRGNLLVGSSRQFIGFNKEMDESIVQRIWDRAGEYFPALKSHNIKEDKNIRIGHRPYMPDGKPVIGPVPALQNLFLATGHEGSGLSMALGTAEMVADMILGNSETIDRTPYSVQGRFS